MFRADFYDIPEGQLFQNLCWTHLFKWWDEWRMSVVKVWGKWCSAWRTIKATEISGRSKLGWVNRWLTVGVKQRRWAACWWPCSGGCHTGMHWGQINKHKWLVKCMGTGAQHSPGSTQHILWSGGCYIHSPYFPQCWLLCYPLGGLHINRLDL